MWSFLLGRESKTEPYNEKYDDTLPGLQWKADEDALKAQQERFKLYREGMTYEQTKEYQRKRSKGDL